MDKVTGIKVLRQALAMPGISRSSIGKALGVDASQVSRIAAGRFVKLEGHALRVCKYAQSLVGVVPSQQVAASPALTDVVNRLVEENPRAALALAELLEVMLSTDPGARRSM